MCSFQYRITRSLMETIFLARVVGGGCVIEMDEYVVTPETLKIRQAWPFELKVQWAKAKIKEWVQYWGVDNVYVSFSGGKDSTVLLHLARELYPNIKAAFIDTGLEHPEVREFVRTWDNVDWVKPEKSFRQVIEKHGYPVVSKETACYIGTIRRNADNEAVVNRYKYGILPDGRRTPYKLPKKWWYLLDADFKISDKCCAELKKGPIIKYEHKNGVVPIVGSKVADGIRRRSNYFKGGCNAFNAKRPMSKPLSIWTDQDVLRYIKENNLPIAKCYGEIVEQDGMLTTTGEKGTGCMFCVFGVHLEQCPNKFQRMKVNHPKRWEYCMKPFEKGGLGLKHVLETLGVPYE